MWMCGYRFPCVLCICVTVTAKPQIIEFGIGCWLCISVPGTIIVLMVILIIAGLIDLPTNVLYSAERVNSNWQPRLRAATLKDTAIWTWAKVGCLHNLFLDSIRCTALKSKIALRIRLAPWRATPQHWFFNFHVIVLARKELSIIPVRCRCLVCWSRSSSLSVLHSEYQVWRQSHCCLWGSVPVSKHLWKSTETFFMLFSICCWPMVEFLCTRWSTWISVSGKGIHHVVELVNYSGPFWFRSTIMYPHYFGIFITSMVHY